MTDCCVPDAVMNDLPSGIIARPSSSLAPDGVNCCGVPSGKCCLQTWKPAVRVSTVKYIHLPSGDHCAELHEPSGPTDCPNDDPSNGTSRQRRHHCALSISTTSTHFPSGESADLCAIPLIWSRGT